MPTIQVQPSPTPLVEPISLARAAAWLRLDLNPELLAAYTSDPKGDLMGFDAQTVADLDNVAMLRTAAREKVEAYTGRYYSPQRLSLTYCLGEPYELPAGATAVSVSGFFTDLTQLDDLAAWLLEYQKGITVERQLPLVEALGQTYTVVADTQPDAAFRGVAERAMLELLGEWYRNRETSGSSQLAELPVSFRVTLAEARVNPLGVGI